MNSRFRCELFRTGSPPNQSQPAPCCRRVHSRWLGRTALPNSPRHAAKTSADAHGASTDPEAPDIPLRDDPEPEWRGGVGPGERSVTIAVTETPGRDGSTV